MSSMQTLQTASKSNKKEKWKMALHNHFMAVNKDRFCSTINVPYYFLQYYQTVNYYTIYVLYTTLKSPHFATTRINLYIQQHVMNRYRPNVRTKFSRYLGWHIILTCMSTKKKIGRERDIYLIHTQCTHLVEPS